MQQIIIHFMSYVSCLMNQTTFIWLFFTLLRGIYSENILINQLIDLEAQ